MPEDQDRDTNGLTAVERWSIAYTAKVYSLLQWAANSPDSGEQPLPEWADLPVNLQAGVMGFAFNLLPNLATLAHGIVAQATTEEG